MGWIFRASDVPVQGDPCDDTIINGVPYEARQAAGSGAIQSAAPAAGPDERIAEQIREKQRRLLERYVRSVRLR
jgi:hypothetical protein